MLILSDEEKAGWIEDITDECSGESKEEIFEILCEYYLKYIVLGSDSDALRVGAFDYLLTVNHYGPSKEEVEEQIEKWRSDAEQGA